MTSKNLYFKLMKEDLKRRLWAMALLGLCFFFVFPVVVTMRASAFREEEFYGQYLWNFTDSMTQWLAFSNGLVTLIIMVAAVICGMSSFSYLNSRSKVDFYHALPIRREKLYITNFIDGILIIAVPYGIMLLAGMMISIANGIKPADICQIVLVGYGLNLLYFILIYTVVVVAVMLTGNQVVAFLGFVVLSFILPCLVLLVSGYLSAFFQTAMDEQIKSLISWSVHLSPVLEYVNRPSHYDQVMPTITAIVTSLLLTVLGGFLYHKRPSEAAGKAMVFQITKPIVRIVIVMMSTLFLGLFFWSVQEGMLWAVFGICCGGVISHCVIEIIYHFDFKKLFSGKWQLLGCLVVSTFILCLFRYDWLGYDRYLPRENQIKTAAVNIPEWNGWVSYGKCVENKDGFFEWRKERSETYVLREMKDADVAAVRQIAADGIGALQRDIGENQMTVGVQICYTLNSGRKVYRSYWVPMNQLEADLLPLYTSTAYSEAVYPVMSLSAEQVAEVRFRDVRPEVFLKNLSKEEKGELLTAYQQELKTMGVDQMKRETPVGLIRFVTTSDSEGLSRNKLILRDTYYSAYDYYNPDKLEVVSFYPVYRSFKQTCRLLEKYGIEPGGGYASYPIECYRIKDYEVSQQYWIVNGEYPQYIISDPAEVQQLNQVVSDAQLEYYNPLQEVENLDMTIQFVRDGESVEERVSISRQQMPEFLRQRLAENRE